MADGKKAGSRRQTAPKAEKKWKGLGKRRFAELVQKAVDLVEDGHSEGGEMFELLDEIDRLEGRPRTSDRYVRERGWSRTPPVVRRRKEGQ